jgi:phosphopantothenoylcysteine decarboxylase/phosphopantothenate--cysteine ligase
MLREREIILCVTGGIAAYKSAEILRELIKLNANVHVIMTKNAQEFITPLTFQTLSRNPVSSNLFSLTQESNIGHISLADRGELFVIAPATANIIGKIANGIADDLLTTTIMATKAKVLIAPAMNVNMYRNPVVRENIEKLKKRGYYIIDPGVGELACGYEGEGRLAEIEDIIYEIINLLNTKDLKDENILVTGGPTREFIDPVRFISNPSSGKMGYAIAKRAYLRGAKVILISGPAAIRPPKGVKLISVDSAEDMKDAVFNNLNGISILIKAAAVADYRPKVRNEEKIKKDKDILNLELERNPDILEEIGKNKDNIFLVGFAAETTDIISNAKDKLIRKNLDLIVVNDIKKGIFTSDKNEVIIIDTDGNIKEVPLMNKERIADIILDSIIERKYGKRRSE